MKTIFIILNYKTYNETIAIANELLRGIGDRMIVIVDNASPNESFRVLRNAFQNETKVEVISSGENGGYARGNNFALRYIKKYAPQYVCIINNDVHFDISLIERMEMKYAEIKDVAFLAPIQYLVDGKPARFQNLKVIPNLWEDVLWIMGLGKYSRHVYLSDSNDPDLQKVSIVPGAFLFINYSLFEKIGFFYEGTFLFCEERFLARRVEDNRLHNYILLNEHYIHAHSVTINSEASKRRQRKLLFEGKVLYTKCCRRFSLLKMGLLYLVFYASMPLWIVVQKWRKSCV